MLEGVVLNFLDEGGGILKIKVFRLERLKKCSIFGIYHPPPPTPPPLLITGP